MIDTLPYDYVTFFLHYCFYLVPPYLTLKFYYNPKHENEIENVELTMYSSPFYMFYFVFWVNYSFFKFVRKLKKKKEYIE